MDRKRILYLISMSEPRCWEFAREINESPRGIQEFVEPGYISGHSERVTDLRELNVVSAVKTK